MKRIYDDPNHKHYGPVRRMWVIFAQLGLLELTERHRRPDEKKWDRELGSMLQIGVKESDAQRVILARLFERMKV